MHEDLKNFRKKIDFKEMQAIEKEFGPVQLGIEEEKKLGLEHEERQRKKELLELSLWRCFSNRIINTDQKFHDWMEKISNSIELQLLMQDKQKKKKLDNFLQNKNVARNKIEMQDFIRLAKQQNNYSHDQITGMILQSTAVKNAEFI
jgi:argonaute-like protein implicated in RNA metabolism and viral defense